MTFDSLLVCTNLQSSKPIVMSTFLAQNGNRKQHKFLSNHKMLTETPKIWSLIKGDIWDKKSRKILNLYKCDLLNAELSHKLPIIMTPADVDCVIWGIKLYFC